MIALKYVVVLINVFNLLDLITTHIALNTNCKCIEANSLAYTNPLLFYVLKALLILLWSLILYRLTRGGSKLVSETSKVLLWFLMILYLLAVFNNTLILIINMKRW